MPKDEVVQIPVDAALVGDGEVLQEWAARRILSDRLGWKGARDFGLLDIAIPDLMLMQIPPEARTAQFLQVVDLRTLLDNVRRKHGAGPGRQIPDRMINGAIVNANMQRAADVAYRYHVEQLRGQLIAEGLAAGRTPERAEIEAGAVLDKNEPVVLAPGSSTSTSASTVTSALPVAPGEASFLDLVGDLASDEPAGAFLTASDIEFLFRTESPDAAIGLYLQDLQAREQSRAAGAVVPADPLTVGYAGPTRQPSSDVYLRPGASPSTREQARTGARSYRLTEALALPYGMTRDERLAVTEKMRAAGLFQQAAGEPVINGDPTDPAFKAAWRLLLSKSIQTGQPVVDILQEMTLGRNKDAARTVTARYTDPATIRVAADALAQQLVGRRLAPAERQAIVDTIRQLETNQATQEQRVQDGTSNEVTAVDWQARMEERLRQLAGNEIAARETAQQYATFRDIATGGT